MTISELAKSCAISRGSVLYYERLGLISSVRAANGYRHFGDEAKHRLRAICAYRSQGVSLADIRVLLDEATGIDQRQTVLLAHLQFLQGEVKRLQQHQKAVISLLGQYQQVEEGTVDMIDKERWVAIMRASGMSDDDMRRWHQQFERMEPEGHQEFLESLRIESEEIIRIRQWSQH